MLIRDTNCPRDPSTRILLREERKDESDTDEDTPEPVPKEIIDSSIRMRRPDPKRALAGGTIPNDQGGNEAHGNPIPDFRDEPVLSIIHEEASRKTPSLSDVQESDDESRLEIQSLVSKKEELTERNDEPEFEEVEKQEIESFIKKEEVRTKRKDQREIESAEWSQVRSLAGLRSEIDSIRKHYMRLVDFERDFAARKRILVAMFEEISLRLVANDAVAVIHDSRRAPVNWKEHAGSLLGGSLASLVSFGGQSWTDRFASEGSSGLDRHTAYLPGAGLFGITQKLGQWAGRRIAGLLAGGEERSGTMPDPLPVRVRGSHSLGHLVNQLKCVHAPYIGIFSVAYFLSGMMGNLRGQYSQGIDPRTDRDHQSEIALARMLTAMISGALTGVVSQKVKRNLAENQIQKIYTSIEGKASVDLRWMKEIVLAMQFQENVDGDPQRWQRHLRTLAETYGNTASSLVGMFLASQMMDFQYENADNPLKKGFNASLGMVSFLAGSMIAHSVLDTLFLPRQTQWLSVEMDLAFKKFFDREGREYELRPMPENGHPDLEERREIGQKKRNILINLLSYINIVKDYSKHFYIIRLSDEERELLDSLHIDTSPYRYENGNESIHVFDADELDMFLKGISKEIENTELPDLRQIPIERSIPVDNDHCLELAEKEEKEWEDEEEKLEFIETDNGPGVGLIKYDHANDI